MATDVYISHAYIEVLSDALKLGLTLAYDEITVDEKLVTRYKLISPDGSLIWSGLVTGRARAYRRTQHLAVLHTARRALFALSRSRKPIAASSVPLHLRDQAA